MTCQRYKSTTTNRPGAKRIDNDRRRNGQPHSDCEQHCWFWTASGAMAASGIYPLVGRHRLLGDTFSEPWFSGASNLPLVAKHIFGLFYWNRRIWRLIDTGETQDMKLLLVFSFCHVCLLSLFIVILRSTCSDLASQVFIIGNRDTDAYRSSRPSYS